MIWVCRSCLRNPQKNDAKKSSPPFKPIFFEVSPISVGRTSHYMPIMSTLYLPYIAIPLYTHSIPICFPKISENITIGWRFGRFWLKAWAGYWWTAHRAMILWTLRSLVLLGPVVKSRTFPQESSTSFKLMWKPIMAWSKDGEIVVPKAGRVLKIAEGHVMLESSWRLWQMDSGSNVSKLGTLNLVMDCSWFLCLRVLQRPGKGAFFLTGLNEILRAKGVSHLIVCGVTTEAKNVGVVMGWGIFPWEGI